MGEGVVGIDGHEAPLGLRHDLLRDDEHVAGQQRSVGRTRAPFIGAPATIGDTATTLERRARNPSAIAGKAIPGPIDTIGFDGAMTTRPAGSIAATPSGPGRASSSPAKRTALTATSWCIPT